MTSRIKKLFATQKAYVGYLTVGDGGMQRSLEIARALIAGGVNLLELGVPFSDPVADGPVIQRAAQRALKTNTNLFDVLKLAATLRQEFPTVPLVLFSYFNPMLAAKPEQWLPQAKQNGIDAVLAVDLPFEEGKTFYDLCAANDIAPILLIAPTTSEQRLKMLARHGKGFLYYACRKGITGVRSGLPEDFAQMMTLIKSHAKLPVVVGFGISEATVVKEILQSADGFVVASLFVKALEDGVTMPALTQLTRSLCS